LPDGAAKTALVDRLAVVQAAIDAATALAAAVTAATTAVAAAEAAVTQVSVTTASALVNALPTGVTKTALLARLAVVQAAVTAANTPPTPVNTVAGAPTAVSATAGDASASVSWTAPASNGGAAITNYQIEYSSDSGATWTIFVRTVSTATSATVTGLVNGLGYTFRVKAVNSVGSSAASGVSASVTPTAPVIEPVDKSISSATTFSNNAVVLSAKQKAGLRAYFENYRNAKNLSIEVIGYANSRTSTRASVAAATARAKAVVVFLKTLGIDATITSKAVGKGSKAQAILNIKWVE
jgi:outer membrane protein OmpA-like peptidoglycan-associated protein